MLAINLDEDLIDVKRVAKTTMSLFETTSVSITKFDTPESDGFVADTDTSFREQIFNIAKTEVESMVEPDGIADDIGWESVPLVPVHRRIIDQRRLTCQYPALVLEISGA